MVAVPRRHRAGLRLLRLARVALVLARGLDAVKDVLTRHKLH
jgi:ribosomal protein L30/L7E